MSSLQNDIELDDHGWPVCFDDETKSRLLFEYYAGRICVVLTWINLALVQTARLYIEQSRNRTQWMRMAMWWFLSMGFLEGFFALVLIVYGSGNIDTICPFGCDTSSCTFLNNARSNLKTWAPLYLLISFVWLQRGYIYYNKLQAENAMASVDGQRRHEHMPLPTHDDEEVERDVELLPTTTAAAKQKQPKQLP